MAKFRVIERKRKGSYGAGALQKHFQKNKEWEDYKKKVADEKEKAEKEKKDVKEQTLAGAGFPTATADGKQAIDKMPLGAKKKKKRIIKRVLPTV
jgi:hypothetical protein